MSGWAVGIAAVGAMASSVYSANQQASATKKAADMQEQSAKRQYNQQEQQFNRQNQNKVDIESLLTGNTTSVDANPTMITGPQGVNKKQMNLGMSSLLGG